MVFVDIECLNKGYKQFYIFRMPASLMMSVVVLNSSKTGDSCFNFQEDPILLTFEPSQVNI